MELTLKVGGEWQTFSADEVAEYRAVMLTHGRSYLDLIQDQGLRLLAEQFWVHAPDYFFVTPASSTGKYHAPWSITVGGLFRHVVMGMYMAGEFAHTFGLGAIDRDCAIAAMAGHDCLKYGIDYDVRYTDMHMFLPRSYYGNYKLGHNISKLVTPDKWNVVMDAIERHMGPIATAHDGKVWRTGATCTNRIAPENSVEYVVHLADYTASRSQLCMTDFMI